MSEVSGRGNGGGSDAMITDDDVNCLISALHLTRHSNDPNTKVGALIHDDSGAFISAGWNCLPDHFDDRKDIWNNRELKLKYVIHAEMNALIDAIGNENSARGGTLYLACVDKDEIWGGCPCTRCAVHLIHAGIKRIVSPPRKIGPSAWKEDIDLSESILREAGVEIVTVPLDYLK